MASDFSMRAMNAIHRGLLRISGGKIGWQAMGMPMLELTTVGRMSGEARATMLSSPLQIGENVVVVASRGGDDKHPAWYLNLVDNPRVEVVIRGKAREVRNARVATPSERERLWPIIASKYANYGGYQKKTEREIPLVFLEPVAADQRPGAGGRDGLGSLALGNAGHPCHPGRASTRAGMISTRGCGLDAPLRRMHV